MKSKSTVIHRFFIPLIILFPLLTTPGCKSKPDPETLPNIILITIDTLRADHMSCYGYHRQTSPVMDFVSRQGILFNRAYSTSSWTAPAMASIFTGHYPRNHGVLHGVAKGPGADVTGQERLVDDFVTLPEVLKEAGYTTFGISSNGHISWSTGFGQGFDHFKTHWFMKSPAPNSTIKRWKKSIRSAKPYFLWIHYFDPHNPYAPRAPWIKKYIGAGRAESKYNKEVMGNPKEYIDTLKTDPHALQILIDRYDSEINYTDYHIGKIFKELMPDEKTMVIITSDHGEAFLDHGQLLHGDTLFEEEIHVPLIIRLPGASPTPKKIDAPVSNRDIFATILDITGIEPDEPIPGRSLRPYWTPGAKREPEPIYFELDWNGYWKGVRNGNWKFLTGGTGKPVSKQYLFDLSKDPKEKQNLHLEQPPKRILMNKLLEDWINKHPEFKAPRIKKPVKADQENKLKTLGYL